MKDRHFIGRAVRKLLQAHDGRGNERPKIALSGRIEEGEIYHNTNRVPHWGVEHHAGASGIG